VSYAVAMQIVDSSDELLEVCACLLLGQPKLRLSLLFVFDDCAEKFTFLEVFGHQE
jgi:hypothetical protein